MKKITIYLAIATTALVTACKKDKPNVDFSSIGTIVEISSSNINSTQNAPSSGLDYFNAATLPYIGADTTFDVTFDVNIASDYPMSTDTKVTVGVDDAKRVTYNSANGSVFLAQPDSTYSFPVKTQVIKAGARIATFKVTFYPQKLNPVLSYMLPVSLTDASGLTISGNLGTIYLHIIGNPLAGNTNWIYKRYNAADTTGAVTTTTTGTQLFVPDDATTVEVQSGYGGQNGFKARYVLSFTNNNGVLSNFKVHINTDDVKNSLGGAGITLSADATIIVADPVAKHFRFTYGVLNSTPAPRTFIDDYIKQ
jgi:hypothetical protein